MNITIITILLVAHVVMGIKHLYNKPDLTQLGFDAAILYYHQLWFLQTITIILVIAVVFYDLLKDKQWQK